MGVSHLAPRILQILSAPDTDLSTVSAKRVRKQLLELEPDITPEYIKENKDAIDLLIGSIFEDMNRPDADSSVDANEAQRVAGTGKRKREEGNGIEENAGDQGQGPKEEDERRSKKISASAHKKQKKGKSSGLTDEEYARQLSSELNQRPSRGSRKTNGVSKKGASRTSKKVKKSREQIEFDSDDEAGGSARKRKPNKAANKGSGGAKGGFAKEFALSDPLAAVLDTPQLSRPQVVKRLWQYIREHELQNPRNKKEILCDDALRAVFNSDKIDMFGMNKTLGQHLYELES